MTRGKTKPGRTDMDEDLPLICNKGDCDDNKFWSGRAFRGHQAVHRFDA